MARRTSQRNVDETFRGTLADAKTGKTVASILSFADDGIVSDSGLFFPDSVIPMTWNVDGHLASIRVTGIG